MTNGRKIVGSIQELGNTYSSSSPVSSSYGIVEFVSHYSRPNCCGNCIYSSFLSGSFQLILHVSNQIPKGSSKQICQHLACEFYDFVSIMIFIVWRKPSKF